MVEVLDDTLLWRGFNVLPEGRLQITWITWRTWVPVFLSPGKKTPETIKKLKHLLPVLASSQLGFVWFLTACFHICHLGMANSTPRILYRIPDSLLVPLSGLLRLACHGGSTQFSSLHPIDTASLLNSHKFSLYAPPLELTHVPKGEEWQWCHFTSLHFSPPWDLGL